MWRITIGELFGAGRRAVELIVSGKAHELPRLLRNTVKGLDLEYVSVEDLGLSPETSHYHSSSGGPACARVFESLSIGPRNIALDLGSGKGGAAITLRQFPFAEVLGVEISPELVRIATRNAARLGLVNVRFMHGDAAAFTDLDRVTHIYMYNPFPCPVVARVMENLADSLNRVDRELVLVYRNPVCDDTVVGSKLFGDIREMQPDHHLWRIYRHLTSNTT